MTLEVLSILDLGKSFQDLEVRDLRKITRYYYVKEGEAVLLECPLVGDPCTKTDTSPCTDENTDATIFVLWEKDESSLYKSTAPSGIFYKFPDQYELLEDGNVNVTRATEEFTGQYECTVYLETGRAKRGTVCLDVGVKVMELVCGNSTERQVSGEDAILETKYIIVISLLAIIIPVVFLCCLFLRKTYQKDPMKMEKSKIYGLVLSFMTRRSERPVFPRSRDGMPLPPTPKDEENENKLNRCLSADSGVSMGVESAARETVSSAELA